MYNGSQLRVPHAFISIYCTTFAEQDSISSVARWPPIVRLLVEITYDTDYCVRYHTPGRCNARLPSCRRRHEPSINIQLYVFRKLSARRFTCHQRFHRRWWYILQRNRALNTGPGGGGISMQNLRSAARCRGEEPFHETHDACPLLSNNGQRNIAGFSRPATTNRSKQITL